MEGQKDEVDGGGTDVEVVEGGGIGLCPILLCFLSHSNKDLMKVAAILISVSCE